ncbi:MAG: electron transfer flavoprotein subunit beta/FixA family protein [Candidatus Neomarinimicrobiota bacterium]
MLKNIIVLAKQVPDTKNVSTEAMKADGTVNRAALPAVFNPEDLNALEMALDVKERFGHNVTVMTMGPPRAADILREALYRGVDRTILITDRAFAGADTLATSYVLALAIKKIGNFDLILAGRQAIDGDTAQIGPQVSEKIGINQITYTTEIVNIRSGIITLSRTLGRISELLKTKLPLLITVPAEANQPRTFGAKWFIKYKKAKTVRELESSVKARIKTGELKTEEQDSKIKEILEIYREKKLLIETWSANDLNADVDAIGLRGSPTKVKKVKSIVLTAAETKTIEATEAGINNLFHELIEDHTFG